MEYKSIHTRDIDFFCDLLGKESVYWDSKLCEPYGKDYTEDLFFLPEVVLFPDSESAVSQIAAYCNERSIPLTPRGAGTGLSGGSLPVNGGVSVSLEKMNRILEIDTLNFQARVQPGVINAVLKEAVSEYGLMYPPDPASLGSSFLGGNVAHASGGPSAIKYGTTANYILNLRVVLASGEVIQTGANTLKNSTGYNLTQLMVGSEGTLGIVTEIVCKLIPKPRHKLLLLARFSTAELACEVVPKLLLEGITPSALEFMELSAMLYSMEFTGISIDCSNTEAFILIELDGNNIDLLQLQAEEVYQVLEKWGAGEIDYAETSEQQEKIWKLRRAMGEAVKSQSAYKEEDIVVPRYALPQIYHKVKELEKKYGFESVSYGHAGDGNLHVNILKSNLSSAQWNHELPIAIRELFESCKQLGGTLSGEHGIGWVQKPYMDIMFPPSHLNLFKEIKKVFDPKGILNPGKIFN